jgi:nicotinamide riboside kinase
MIHKIAILGAESTGKSELSQALSAHYHTLYVPEYARTFFEKKKSTQYTQEDIYEIGLKQLLSEREKVQKVKQKNGKLLFIDTELIMIKIWLLYYNFQVPEWIHVAIEFSEYDLYLLTDNDIAWEPDPLRENENNREELKQMYIDELKHYKKSYEIISGQGDARLRNAIQIIDQKLKK